jgi:hypothetical protein
MEKEHHKERMFLLDQIKEREKEIEAFQNIVKD